MIMPASRTSRSFPVRSQVTAQLATTGSKLTMETLEQGVTCDICLKLTIKTLVSSLLTLNIFHTLF